MSQALLDQLEHVLHQEHASLVAGDWRGLQSCVERKRRLAHQLTLAAIDPGQRERALSVREAVQYNADLAETLSRQLGALMSNRQRSVTYNGGGALPHVAQSLVSVRG